MVLSIREASLPYSHHGKFGLWTGFIFTINCTIGAGFLSIPWAFNNAGWLFCITIQILAGIQGYFLAQQVLELMSRSEVLVRMTEEGKDIHPISWKKLFSKPKTSKDSCKLRKTKQKIFNVNIELESWKIIKKVKHSNKPKHEYWAKLRRRWDQNFKKKQQLNWKIWKRRILKPK